MHQPLAHRSSQWSLAPSCSNAATEAARDDQQRRLEYLHCCDTDFLPSEDDDVSRTHDKPQQKLVNGGTLNKLIITGRQRLQILVLLLMLGGRHLHSPISGVILTIEHTLRAQTKSSAIIHASNCDQTCFGAALAGKAWRQSNKNSATAKPTPQSNSILPTTKAATTGDSSSSHWQR